jgi:succinyl-CoA synthetase beta subunit
MLTKSSAALARMAASRIALRTVPSRALNLHEYQSANILRSHGVNTPKGDVAKTPEEAFKIAQALGSTNMVIKAQVLAGGRGLGHFDNGFKGGVHVGVKTAEEIRDMASKMIGAKLITKQTGAAGRICNTVAIVDAVQAKDEKYVAVLMDRSFGGPVVVASAQGGVTIEDIAAKNPDAIIKHPIDISKGMTADDAALIATKMKFSSQKVTDIAAKNLLAIYDTFAKSDCTMVEVNPFCETVDGDICSVDAKIGFDDNAEFRQKAIHEQRDTSQEDPLDVEAAKFDLNFINLDGNIACLVNGAGLAMATMDIIKLHGGEPANFLDLGGSVKTPQVRARPLVQTGHDHASGRGGRCGPSPSFSLSRPALAHSTLRGGINVVPSVAGPGSCWHFSRGETHSACRAGRGGVQDP